VTLDLRARGAGTGGDGRAEEERDEQVGPFARISVQTARTDASEEMTTSATAADETTSSRCSTVGESRNPEGVDSNRCSERDAHRRPRHARH
jgi:hypothetical protein